MIPSNAFTTVPDVKSYISPYNRPYNPLEQAVLGGIALNDPSRGRMYQNWIVFYESPFIRVKPENGAVAFSLQVADITSVSLAFDNNMNIALCWQKAAGSTLYYFDIVLNSYTTLDIPNGNSSRIVVDDPRSFYTTDSDIIFGYTLGGNLYWRQQRDRYQTQRLVGVANGRLLKMAPTIGNRLQFELG